jgi:outer membrane protein OmpA-like peptidoglycan-associated protein
MVALLLAPASASADGEVPDWVRPRGRVVVTSTSCTILGPITFAAGAETIAPAHAEILDATAETLIGNPSIELMAVQTYGDPLVAGDEVEIDAAQALADVRAQLVVMYLASRGVEPWRLVPDGHGVREDSEDGRVKFLILRRTP